MADLNFSNKGAEVNDNREKMSIFAKLFTRTAI